MRHSVGLLFFFSVEISCSLLFCLDFSSDPCSLMSNQSLPLSPPASLSASIPHDCLTASTTSNEADKSCADEPAPSTTTPIIGPSHRLVLKNAPPVPTFQRRNSLQSLGSITHLRHLYNGQDSERKIKSRDYDAGRLSTSCLPPLHSRNYDVLKEEAHSMWLKCCQSWSLIDLYQTPIVDREDDLENSLNKAGNVDLCQLLMTTRKTLQCVRDYLLAVPTRLLEDGVESEKRIGRATSKSTFRRRSTYYCSPRQEVGYGESNSLSGEGSLSGFSRVISKQKSEGNLQKGQGSYKQPKVAHQPLPSVIQTTALVRRLALDVLLQLKQLEQMSSNEEDPSFDLSLSDLTMTETSAIHHLQDKHVSLDNLNKERICVRQYLDLVRSTFDRISQKKALDEQKDQSSTSSLQVTPSWSTYSAKEGLPGALNILRFFIPQDVHRTAPNSEWTRRSALEALSDGYLLCQAFNGAALASSKPWGLISECDINELKGDSDKPAASWTFRKRQNLIVWIAALKARYGLPIASFDTVSVAKAGSADDWMDMLQITLCLWAQAVADEAHNLK